MARYLATVPVCSPRTMGNVLHSDRDMSWSQAFAMLREPADRFGSVARERAAKRATRKARRSM